MNNRSNKSKKHSKLKQTVTDNFAYNSPAKFITTAALSSGCCPKNPPNVSRHYLQKKRQEITGQYYIGGKQNKSRIMNNASQKKQHISIMQTTDRFRQKRNTCQLVSYQVNHAKPLQAKRPIINYYQNINSMQTFKSINKTKTSQQHPIGLGPKKSQKTRLHKQADKENRIQKVQKIQKIEKIEKSQKSQKFRRFQRQLNKQSKQRSSYLPQTDQCQLACFQYLSSNSIAHSKASTNNFIQMNSLDESNIIVQKQPSIQSRKGFHKSPKILSPTTSITIKIPQKTPEQQLAEFQSRINEINTNFQHDSLTYMQRKDQQFVKSKNLNCYLSNQLYLDWKKRAMVISWMIEVMAEIGGKRQTLANAVNIFDRYLSLTLNIPLDHIQCTAVAALLIAAKLQDKSLNAYYLSQTTLQKYTAQQIMQEEYKIFLALNFKVNTPTLNSWANRLAVQWDIYLQSTELRHYDIIFNNISIIKFKNSDETSYYNYRWLCQYLDFSIMDIYTLRYQPRMLSLAFIYLILVMRLNLATKEKVVSVFPNSSQFLFQQSLFHDFFSKFLRDSFSQQLNDLFPMIQYCSTFVILPLRFDLPTAIPESNMQNQDQEVNYEHFCSYQTKNQHTLTSLYSRNRNVY